MPARSSSSIHPVLAELVAAADARRLSGTGLLAVLARVPDPRKRRGVRHSITTILGARGLRGLGWLSFLYRDRPVGRQCLRSDPCRAGGGWVCAVRVNDSPHVAAAGW
ncbi:MAG: transposase family protein [Actinomycetota bacterium]|nr:transposase family protein [Actinomycetota bacterium]